MSFKLAKQNITYKRVEMALQTTAVPQIGRSLTFERRAKPVVKLSHIENWQINVCLIAPTSPDS